MPGQDVGVEPHGERERFGELRDPLDKEHEGTMMGLAGMPGGTNASTYPTGPLRLMPTTWVIPNVNSARTRVNEMLLVTGKLLGTRPSKLKTSKKMKQAQRVREPLPTLLAHLAADAIAPEAVELLHDDLVGPRPLLQDAAPMNMIRNVRAVPINRNTTALVMEMSMPKSERCTMTCCPDTHAWMISSAAPTLHLREGERRLTSYPPFLSPTPAPGRNAPTFQPQSEARHSLRHRPRRTHRSRRPPATTPDR